jgi:4'-phosphopantetheinyl transferase EntD
VLIQGDPLGGRLLFAVKEAVYKAVYPLDGVFLDHEDVDVNLRDGIAVVRNSRPLHFRYCIAMHMVALAFIPAR